jgi:hypothetical protein
MQAAAAVNGFGEELFPPCRLRRRSYRIIT